MSLYGLTIGIAIIIGINQIPRIDRVIPSKKIPFMIFCLLFFALIGARLYHVFHYWNYYSQNPGQIPNTPLGGLAIYGALLGAFSYLWVYSLLNKKNLIELTDIFTPILPLMQAIGRFGNFFNHEVYSTSGQPLWLYESVLNFILFMIIKFQSKNPTAIYLIGYGLIRSIIENWRHDTWILGHIKIAQSISFFFIIIGVKILLDARKTKGKK